MFSHDFRGAQPCAMTTGDLLTLSGLRSNKTCRVKTCRLLKTGCRSEKIKLTSRGCIHLSPVMFKFGMKVFGVKFIEQGKSIRAGPGLIHCQKDKKKKEKKLVKKNFLRQEVCCSLIA